MVKWLLLLIVIFVAIYIGGSVLLDTGAKSYQVARIPEAQVAEKIAVDFRNWLTLTSTNLYTWSLPTIIKTRNLLDPVIKLIPQANN